MATKSFTTLEQLRKEGYRIENGILQDAGFYEVNGVMTVGADVKFSDSGCCRVGGFTCGQYIPQGGILAAIRGSRFGMEAFLWMMAVAGVDNSKDLTHKYVRVAFDPATDRAKYIGHVVDDLWFSFDDLAEEVAKKEAKNG